MLGRAEPDLLRKRDPQHHPRLAVVGKPLSRRAVDQVIEVGHPPKHLAGNGDRQSLVGGFQARRRLRRRVERAPAPKHGVQHLQRGAARR